MATRCVALLRGINVGGRNPVAMADLRAAFETEGYDAVSTYIQSGNVLFESAGPSRTLEHEVEAMLERRLGLALVVVVRSLRQLRAIVDKAPDGFGDDPDSYHSDVVFLRGGLSSRQAMRVVELREGVDQAWAGTGVVYFAGERPPHPEPDEPHRRHPRVPADDDPQLEHDDEAAAPARGRSMTALDAFGPRSWARPEATGFGRLPMSTHLVRPDELALDGTWAFSMHARPEDGRTGRPRPAAPTGGPTIEVPGCWTMQGFGTPAVHERADAVPGSAAGDPDRQPDRGPPPHGDGAGLAGPGQRIVLHVAGAESVLYVHVDGEPVGMGKDSRLPHEFDLTDVVEPGRPFELALTVVQWSDATYLEDQDHWYHAGLHRSVFLRAMPPVHIADVDTVADFDPATGERPPRRAGAGGHRRATDRRAGRRPVAVADQSVDRGRSTSSTRPTGW